MRLNFLGKGVVQMSQKKCTLSDEMCDDFDEKLLDGLLNKFKEVFSDTPGLCRVGECVIKIAEGSEVVNKTSSQNAFA